MRAVLPCLVLLVACNGNKDDDTGEPTTAATDDTGTGPVTDDTGPAPTDDTETPPTDDTSGETGETGETGTIDDGITCEDVARTNCVFIKAGEVTSLLDAANLLEDDSAIVLDAGTWAMNNALTIRSVTGITIIGQGMGETVLDFSKVANQVNGVDVIADDFHRMQTSLFQGTHPKPLLELYGERLEVRNVPVPPRLAAPLPPATWRRLLDGLAITRLVRERTGTTGPGEGAFGTRESQSQPFEPVAEYLFRDLAATSAARGQEFALVFLPTAGQVQRGEPPLAAWLREFCREAQITYLDLTPEFDPVPAAELDDYFTQGHYSGKGNALVARAIERLVDDQFRD